MSDAAPAFDSDHFRKVMGHFPTGVTIITGMAGDVPAGFTIGSFTSVSLDPPLVGFFPMLISDTWAAMSSSGKFCVNILSADMAAACWRFAKKGVDDRFADVTWHHGVTGSPVLDSAIAWIDCETDVVYTVGDHYFVVGRVIEMSHSDDDPQPLLFYRGKLGGYTAHG